MEVSDVGATISRFLAEQSDEFLDALYLHGPSVRVVLREALAPVAQQLIMRLVFGGARPFQEAVLRKWCAGAPLQSLQRLRVLRAARSEKRLLLLHRNFQATLRNFLEGKDNGKEKGKDNGKEKGKENEKEMKVENTKKRKAKAKTDAELMQHAVSSWDKFLEGLTKGRVSSVFTSVLQQLQLSQGGALTAQGFQFILDERQQQLWRLLLEFIKNLEFQEKLSCLKLIFELGELHLGDVVCVDSVDSAADGQQQQRVQRFLAMLLELGILCESGEFFATPAALALFRKDFSMRLSRVTGKEEEGLGIVVESNFKVYCYCVEASKSLWKTLLGFFAEISLELPRLLVAQLTAESVLRALKRGVRAQHILRFLDSAKHQKLQGIPSNVAGQLEVWESSRSRAATSEAQLFEWQPGDPDEIFLEAEQLAKDAGSFLWSRQRAFDLPPLLLVHPAGAQQIRDLLKVKEVKEVKEVKKEPQKPKAPRSFAFALKATRAAPTDVD